jgi:glycosyltransferase involved in cell wall biosynthesis
LPKTENPFIDSHRLNDNFIVLYSGNQGRCHDLVTLIDAADQLRDHSNILFLIVGSGAQHRQLVERVHSLSLPNVHFLPYQESDQLPFLLAAADLAIVSLLKAAEGMVAPSKLYGHLAAATPVAAICSPSSYLRTEIARGDCGRCFSSGESSALESFILELYNNPTLSRDLGLSGRRYLLATSTPTLVVQAYAEMLARHLPLTRKTYASPLHCHSEPLPDPNRELTPTSSPLSSMSHYL